MGDDDAPKCIHCERPVDDCPLCFNRTYCDYCVYCPYCSSYELSQKMDKGDCNV